ncbi:hypothetical protein H8356DRAFT_1418995 [Neocallimastix lanati (nom. inval.)]|nr:hypothetical protein H8356DRAFT_1418995 [Neocallimastix sp. JGI-2020a]
MEYTNKHEIIQTLIDKNKDGGYQLLLTNFNKYSTEHKILTLKKKIILSIITDNISFWFTYSMEMYVGMLGNTVSGRRVKTLYKYIPFNSYICYSHNGRWKAQVFKRQWEYCGSFSTSSSTFSDMHMTAENFQVRFSRSTSPVPNFLFEIRTSSLGNYILVRKTAFYLCNLLRPTVRIGQKPGKWSKGVNRTQEIRI